MAKYLSTQYSNNKPANQRGGKKKEIKRRVMDGNLKTRIVTLMALPVYMLKTLQQLKNPLSLTELLA